MTGYGVKIVPDETLSPDVDWMFVKSADGALILYISRTAAGCARTLAEAWAAYRALERRAVIPIQRTRVPVDH